MPVMVEFQHPIEIRFLLDTVDKASFKGAQSDLVATIRSDLQRALDAQLVLNAKAAQPEEKRSGD